MADFLMEILCISLPNTWISRSKPEQQTQWGAYGREQRAGQQIGQGLICGMPPLVQMNPHSRLGVHPHHTNLEGFFIVLVIQPHTNAVWFLPLA